MAISSSRGSSRGPTGTATAPQRTPTANNTPAATTYPPAEGRSRNGSRRGNTGNQRSGEQPSGQPSGRQRNPEAAPQGDTLELIDHAPLTAQQQAYDAHLDPLVRGTRPTLGTTASTPLTADAEHGDAAVRATPFNLGISGHDAQGNEGSLTVDRQSALAGGSIPMADGQKATFSGGAFANLAYGSATYHDGHGNSVGAFGMATTQGTPGLGLSFSHVGATASVAASPSVLADKTLEASIKKVERTEATATEAAKVTATVQQSSTRMGLLNVPASVGVGPVSLAIRAYGDAKVTKSYTYKTGLEEAGKQAPRTGILRKRVAGLFGDKNVRQAPKLTEVNKLQPGDQVKEEVGHNVVLSGGANFAGAQLIGGVVRNKKTSATVAVTEAEATGEQSSVKVVLAKETTRGKILAADLPMLAAAHVGQNTVVHRSLAYEVPMSGAAAAIEKKVQRNKTVVGTKGHFAFDQMFKVGTLESLESTADTFETMHDKDPMLRKIQLSVARGGLDWRVGMFQLAASLGGDRFGLSIGQQRNRKVSYRTATKKVAFAADGTMQRTNVEIPYYGSSSRAYQFLQVVSLSTDVNSADLDKIQRTGIVQLAVNHNHASNERTLRSVKSMMERTVPGLLDALPTSEPVAKNEDDAKAKQAVPLPMDLNVSLSAVVTPTVVQKLAEQTNILEELGPVPATAALLDSDSEFFERALDVLERKLKGSSQQQAESAIAKLHDADAHVAVSVHTNLFANVERKVAKVQVQAEAIRQLHKADSPPVIRQKLLKKAAKQAGVLRYASQVLREPMFKLLAKEDRAAHKKTLRTSHDNLAAIFHPDIEAHKAGTLSASPRTKSWLDDLAFDNGLLSPEPRTVELDPFDGAIPILTR